jgi:IS30 family transposase
MNYTYSHIEETERYMIMCAYETGQSLRQIARHLHRSPSTISRELKRNKEPWGYDALKAHHKALDRWCIARTARKLDVHRRLRYYVRRKLDMYWSPQQIAGRIRADFPNDKDMRISHETIYAYIYAMPKGRLRQEIIANLRRKHPYRQKQGRCNGR